MWQSFIDEQERISDIFKKNVKVSVDEEEPNYAENPLIPLIELISRVEAARSLLVPVATPLKAYQTWVKKALVYVHPDKVALHGKITEEEATSFLQEHQDRLKNSNRKSIDQFIDQLQTVQAIRQRNDNREALYQSRLNTVSQRFKVSKNDLVNSTTHPATFVTTLCDRWLEKESKKPEYSKLYRDFHSKVANLCSTDTPPPVPVANAPPRPAALNLVEDLNEDLQNLQQPEDVRVVAENPADEYPLAEDISWHSDEARSEEEQGDEAAPESIEHRPEYWAEMDGTDEEIWEKANYFFHSAHDNKTLTGEQKRVLIKVANSIKAKLKENNELLDLWLSKFE